jgi:hypothetical protein
MESLLARRRQLAKLARQGSLAQPRTRTMKTQNRRKIERSEDVHLCSWNNLIPFISGFKLDGAVLVTPFSFILCCPFEVVDGFLVGCWTHIMWWIGSISTLVGFSNGYAKLLMSDYMVALCWLKVEWCSILLSSIKYIQCASYVGFCYALSLIELCANVTSWWGMILYMGNITSFAFNHKSHSISLVARQTKTSPFLLLTSIIHGSSKQNKQ